MTQESATSFRTKTGTCTVTAKEIVLSRHGARGWLAQRMFGDSIRRVLFLRGIIGAGCLLAGIYSLAGQDFVTGVLLILVALYCVSSLVASRGFSAASVMPVDSVVSIETHPPRPPVTRGYFVVHSLQGDKKRKRIIILPGSLSGGSQEFEKAVSVLRQSGLPMA